MNSFLVVFCGHLRPRTIPLHQQVVGLSGVPTDGVATQQDAGSHHVVLVFLVEVLADDEG